jgi:hypothetical protein
MDVKEVAPEARYTVVLFILTAWVRAYDVSLRLTRFHVLINVVQ